ncbi:MAG: transporter substrate-binding domain-containing protein [Comamonadaceae bacterium]|nr:MAG: transporter substrate-binding domain-containing protein [Comamonadaceae bacterium]
MIARNWLRGLGLALAMLGAAQAHAQGMRGTDTLARIQSEGVIRVGVRDSAPPFAYYEQGKPAGFSWSVCQSVVQQLEGELKRPITIQPVPVSLASSFEMLNDGRIDLQCGSTTHTAERARQVDFSNTFFISGIVVSYRKDEVRYANPLQFGRVGVLANSTAAAIMTKRAASKGSSVIDAVVPVGSYDEGIEKLKKKEIDTLFADGVLVPTDAEISRRSMMETIEPYALMLRKGDHAFREKVDQALSKVLGSPGIRQMAVNSRLDGKINMLTAEVWRRPSRDPAPQLY